jgi:protein TonB
MLVLVPVMPVAPTHGLVMTGGETVSGALRPPGLISVEPSGIALPPRVDPVLPPSEVTEPPEVRPPEPAMVEPVMQPEPDMPDPLMPPPSKVPGMPEPVIPVDPVVPQPGSWPKPPGSISVAPRGIPVPVDPVDGRIVPIDPPDPVELIEPGMPRGEVAPNPEGVMTLWA